MTLFLPGGARHGEVRVPASKSAAQRALLLAALSERDSVLLCRGSSRDIEAMIACLRALGADFFRADDEIRVRPIRDVPAGERILPCGESGATLRFLLPLVGVLGAEAVFMREGRLFARPLQPFLDELVRHGMRVREDGALLHVSGRLRGGDWTLPGDVSSQFISALLLSLPLLGRDSTLTITGGLESAPYLALTEQALSRSAIRLEKENRRYTIPGNQRPASPSRLAVEGDWSAAAPFLAMGALSPEGVAVSGLDPASVQGDRAICALLRSFGAQLDTDGTDGTFVPVRKKALRGLRFDASQAPDLVPVVAALGALAEGETRIEHAARLRGKESDRLHTTAAMLTALGAEAEELPDGLVFRGKPFLPGGETESFSDHRVAMAAAVAACGCAEGVVLRDAACVGKSYPRFWDDFASLGGT